MDDHRFHFISGLPRSGSTLLANILAQNPRFHTTQTSGIADVMFMVRNNWNQMIEWRAHPDEEGKKRVLKGILESYYANVDRPIVFDKSRVWVSLLEMANEVLGYKPKVLVPVRDLRDVLASFEKLWRKTSSTGQMAQEKQFYVDFQTVEGRLAAWMHPTQPVGIAYNRIKDAVLRGHHNEMLFIEFEHLTTHPEDTLRKIYEFLGEEWYPHDFENIVQVTQENDFVHGIPGLHDIRQKVEPVLPQWPEILGHAAEPYANLEFWRRL
jgi:sulfotransferase